MFRWSALLLLLTPLLAAAPVRILAIGDSLTEEYAFEFIFSSPAPGQPDNHARNWPELLEAARAGEADFGSYKDSLGGYSDFRNGGYRLNFGIPGYATENWIRVLSTDSYNPISDPFEDLGFLRTREALIDNLPLAEVAVIFLGGNDLKNVYAELFTDTEPSDFFEVIENRLETIHAFIRQRRPDLPIVLAAVPDVGATPEIYQTYDDPVRAATTRQKIADFNNRLAATFTGKPVTTVARIDALTDRIYEADPFQLNGTEFTIPGASNNNPPDHVFCYDDFHPNTVGQALVANEIISAINSLGLGPLTPFGNREILGQLLFLDPDQPYTDFITPFALPSAEPDDDPEGDGLPNLVEMALGTRPDEFSEPFRGAWRQGRSIAWPVDEDALDYLELVPEESGGLSAWTPVPEGRLERSGAVWSASPPPGADRFFFRLEATRRP